MTTQTAVTVTAIEGRTKAYTTSNGWTILHSNSGWYIVATVESEAAKSASNFRGMASLPSYMPFNSFAEASGYAKAYAPETVEVAPKSSSNVNTPEGYTAWIETAQSQARAAETATRENVENNAHLFTFEQLGTAVEAVAVASKVSLLWAVVVRVNESLAIQGRDFDAIKSATRDQLISMLLSGAEDTWSGRGNDLARAGHDGLRKEIQRVLEVI